MRRAKQNWQARRAAYNHDWLKNHYLTVLGSAENALSGRIKSTPYLDHLLRSEVPTWREHRSEVLELLDSFEPNMSPIVLFKEPPLVFGASDSKKCFGELVHCLWLHKYQFDGLITEARECIARIDRAFDVLRGRVLGLSEEAQLLESVVHLRIECTALARLLERLPSDVLVV